MSTTSVFAWDYGSLQVSAGWAGTDQPDVRYLVVGVPDTHDSVRLDWSDGVNLAGTTPVAARLRIGTLAAQQVNVGATGIAAGGLPAAGPFGPSADGILRAVAEPLARFATNRPETLAELREVMSTLRGKVPKDDGTDAPTEDPLAAGVRQCAAAGAALAKLIAGTPAAVAAGAALGALAAVHDYLAG